MDIEDFVKIPKIELHLHLDGSVSLDIAAELSNRSIDEVKIAMTAKDKCADLGEYLTKFSFPISLMQTEERLEIISRDLVNRLASQNIVYAEIRFAPMFHTEKGLSYEKIIESVLKGLKSNSSIKTNLILCLMRGMSDENNLKTIEMAKKYLNNGVCALDLAGDEKKYPISDCVKYFELAKKQNIPFTIHAGESRGAEEVEAAIKLGAKRIGHGIHCFEKENVIELVKKNSVLLEVCPTSNVQTNAVNLYKNHPIKELYNRGVCVCVNTDNATVSNINISEEYKKLHDEFGFEIEDFNKMNIDAIRNSFLNDEEKEKLLKIFK